MVFLTEPLSANPLLEKDMAVWDRVVGRQVVAASRNWKPGVIDGDFESVDIRYWNIRMLYNINACVNVCPNSLVDADKDAEQDHCFHRPGEH